MAAAAGRIVSEQRLTDEQRRAVSLRGVSVGLSAGAGCGKTVVLTERFLSHLAADGPDGRPVELSSLVAITFTDRAAREMRDRIRSAAVQRLLQAPDKEAAYWSGLLRELDTARISTIHSYCTSLLRRHAVEAGLDPRFRVLEEAVAEMLRYELIDEQINQRLAERDEMLIELAAAARGVDRLHSMVSDLLAYRREIDWESWQHETPDSLADRWEGFWDDVREQVLRAIARTPSARRARRLAATAQCSHEEMQRRLAEIERLLVGLPESEQAEPDLQALHQAAQVKGAGNKRHWASEEQYEGFKKAAEKLRKEIKERLKATTFDRECARAAARVALTLLEVTRGVVCRYDQEKRKLAALDFDDLLVRAARLLTAPGAEATRRQTSAGIAMLMVDEFQDTEPVQVELIEQLCDGRPEAGRLFFVGDFKQSIYRFRGADPHVFRRLRNKLPPEGRLPLAQNFRSQPAILEFVNALFEEEFAPDYEPLRPARPQVGPRPAVEFLWAFPGEEMEGQKRIPAEHLRRREADYIARRLRRMFEQEERLVWDEQAAREGEPAVRAAKPGDVALLFRALSNVQLYEEALREYGIDYYLVGGRGFYAQQEVYDLVHLLRAVDNPADTLSLAGVLRSPMFALEDETLFWLSRSSGGLAEGLWADPLPQPLSEPQRRQVRYAAAVIRELRALKDRLPVARLITLAMERTGYDAALLGEFLGERKLANLQKLIDQARSFDQSGIFSLAEFATRLSEFVAHEPPEPPAATCPESVNVVRLMSIHQSKGLEFPVVIVVDADSTYRGPRSLVAFHRKVGPLVREGLNEEAGGRGTKGTKKDDSLSAFELFRLMEAEEDLAERMRLLYVATTRAADYLILSAGLPAIDKISSSWMELLAGRFNLLSGEFIGTRSGRGAGCEPPASGRVMARVLTSVPLRRRKPSPRRRNLAKLAEKARNAARRADTAVPESLAPVPPDPQARREFSFSRLTGRLHGPLTTATRATAPPVEPELDPRGLGTLVHAVMAELDFDRPGDVEALVRRCALRHMPEAEDLQEPVDMVERFLESLRAEDMASAGRMYRELEFMLAWPPGTDDPKAPYLRGYIDCLYEDAAGNWRMVDYKTSHADEQNLHEAAAPYEMQMLAYALAVEEILGRGPDALVLCFLRPGLEYHIPWDARARRRIIEMIDRSLSEFG